MTGGSLRVAVIGGGIVGTATAAFLAEGGASVTLYEREALAAGASGRNSGVVQQPFDPALVPLYVETREAYCRLAAQGGPQVADFDAPPAGLLLVSHHLRVVEATAADLAGRFPDLEPEVLGSPALRRLEPALADGVVACRVAIGYPVVPSAPTYAFASLADRRGVTIRLGRQATPSVRDGRCDGVLVDGRLDPADAVVVAAGPWSARLVDQTGSWAPIAARWGVVVETRLPDAPRHVLEEAEMEEALGTGEVPASDADVADRPRDPETEPSFSLVTAKGASAVGSTFLSREPDPPSWTERLLEHATTFVPSVLDAPIREVRACARPASPDGRPLVGAVPWINALFLAAGHGPWGISTGPASARHVADLVLGRAVEIDPAFSVSRFGQVDLPILPA